MIRWVHCFCGAPILMQMNARFLDAFKGLKERTVFVYSYQNNYLSHLKIVILQIEVTKRVYFIGNERMLIAHDSNRLRFS